MTLIYYNYYIYTKTKNQKNFTGVSRIVPIFTRDGLFTGKPVLIYQALSWFSHRNPCAKLREAHIDK